MQWLNKLQGHTKSPAGLEWKLLRRMPKILFIGTAIPVVVVVLLHGLSWTGEAHQVSATLGKMDFIAIGAVIVYWTAILTLTIGCIIVILMKGPAYVADAYPLVDADRPAPK